MREINSKSNLLKTQAGQEQFEDVKNVLLDLKKNGLIKDFQENINVAHKDYKYKSQFKIDFKVKTIDDKYLIIRTSKSYRHDRAKIFFYDFMGVNLYSDLSDNIIASILLFPDDELNNTSFINNRNKLLNKEFYSPATHWLVKSEFLEYIKNYQEEAETLLEQEQEYLQEIKEQKHAKQPPKHDEALYLVEFDEDEGTTQLNQGSYYGRVGFMLEKYLVEQLNSPKNLIAFKKGEKRCKEFQLIMEAILEHHKLGKEHILSIEATDTITKLKTLGSPKTDVHLRITTLSDGQHIITANISVKNTSNRPVSCHDYVAEDFCRVVNPDDADFCTAVNIFQKSGSWTAFKKHIKNDEQLFKYYVDVLRQNMRAIINWAITGEGDWENITDAEMQIANYIFIRRRDIKTNEFYTADQYIERLIDAARNNKSPGAPFSWTYPSKQRGKRIQLKMPVL